MKKRDFMISKEKIFDGMGIEKTTATVHLPSAIKEMDIE